MLPLGISTLGVTPAVRLTIYSHSNAVRIATIAATIQPTPRVSTVCDAPPGTDYDEALAEAAAE